MALLPYIAKPTTQDSTAINAPSRGEPHNIIMKPERVPVIMTNRARPFIFTLDSFALLLRGFTAHNRPRGSSFDCCHDLQNVTANTAKPTTTNIGACTSANVGGALFKAMVAITM